LPWGIFGGFTPVLTAENVVCLGEDFDLVVVGRRIVILELFEDGIDIFESVSDVFKFLVQMLPMPFEVILKAF